MPRSPSLARDAALYRMRRINRWLIAGTVVATGFLTDVAAQAFPGHTIKRTAGSSSTSNGTLPATKRHTHHHRAGHHALTPPAKAPQPQVVEPVPGASSNTGNTGNTGGSAPAAAQSAPAPAPVVSGGS